MKSLIPWKNKKIGPARRAERFLTEDSPFSLSRLRDEFDRFFDRLARDFPAMTELEDAGWRWGLDVADEADKVVVQAEAPGFDIGDFDLRVDDGRLVLSASKEVKTKDEKGNIQEYRQQECYESVALPEGIDQDKVEAKYHKGVLTVTLPKTEAGRAKKVAVKAS
jgi:HSP20 family protein